MKNLEFNRIHKFVFDDCYIILDVNSGSIHLGDALFFDYLDFLEEEPQSAMPRLVERYGEEACEGLEEALRELIDEGLLFSEADFSDYKPHKEPLVKAMCFHMAHDCNLRCGYCFADTGSYGGGRSLMSLETGKKAIDLLMKLSKHRKHVEIDFFGGEPLLNFEVCKALAKYGHMEAKKHGKILKLTLTTNGVLLDDEVIDWANQHEMDAVLSLDGREHVHNRMRKFTNGANSYQAVVEPFKRFVASRQTWQDKKYYLRGTYTHFNTDFADDVIHMADDLGFTELSMEPVVAKESLGYALKKEDMPDLLASYDKLTRHYAEREDEGKGYQFFHFNVDFDGGPCLPKRLSGCGAGHDYLAVSPEGDLYPCHQFVGEEDYKMGTVETGIIRPELAERFQTHNVLKKDLCMQCWARFYCSGGCHANNLRYGGGLDEPYLFGCDLQKKRIECGIYLGVRRYLKENGE